MARNLYPGVFVQLSSGGPGPNLPVTIWTDPLGGTNVTLGLLAADNTTPYTPTTDGSGNLLPFRGPDGYNGMLWVDSNTGIRYELMSSTAWDDLLVQVTNLLGLVTSGNIGGGVTDHGALSGLGDDDHPQYHTDARGDARYYLKAVVDAAITSAVQAASVEDRKRSNHSGTQTASSISDFVAAVQAVPGAAGGGAPDYNNLLNVPATFPPSPHTHASGDISDSSAIGRAVLKAIDAQAARAAIGAGTGNGTSNLALGNTATTAAPGNHTHTASSISFTPTGSITAADVQTAIQQAAQSGGGSGVSAVYIWRYTAGAYPAMPSAKPSGVMKVECIGPSYPTGLVPSWCGLAAAQVPLSYSKVNVA